MSGEIMKKNRLFFAWHDDAEEKWLREMAKEGWTLKTFCLGRYTFEKSEPKDYIYRLDYRTVKREEMNEYKGIFGDAGWEHVLDFSNWHYFKADPDDCSAPDIFSDNESRIEKYSSLLKFLLLVLGMEVMLAVSVVFNDIYDQMAFMIVLRVVYILLILLLSYGSYRLYRVIQALKARG